MEEAELKRRALEKDENPKTFRTGNIKQWND
jgi:hypothetical protein